MRVEITRVIENSIDRVWYALADFGKPHLVDDSITTKWARGEGVGAVREIALPSGRGATELMVVCDSDSFTVAYTILPPARVAAKNYVTTVRLRLAGPGRTEVQWVMVAEFEPHPDYPTATEDTAASAGRRSYERFIDGLEQYR
jgi:hypothetical protein